MPFKTDSVHMNFLKNWKRLQKKKSKHTLINI